MGGNEDPDNLVEPPAHHLFPKRKKGWGSGGRGGGVVHVQVRVVVRQNPPRALSPPTPAARPKKKLRHDPKDQIRRVVEMVDGPNKNVPIGEKEKEKRKKGNQNGEDLGSLCIKH